MLTPVNPPTTNQPIHTPTHPTSVVRSLLRMVAQALTLTLTLLRMVAQARLARAAHLSLL